MTLFAVDVYSGSADSIIQDSHAQAVIVKATQGTYYVNPKCNHQWDLTGQLGKLRGLYHYAGGGDPVAEAQYFIRNIKNYVGQGVLAVDWEEGQNTAWGNTNWVRQFVDEVHKETGVWPMIYVQASALDQVANCANDCALWVADYPRQTNGWTLPDMNVPSGAWSTITGWQFTGDDMDRDIFYLDEAGWNKLANPSSSSSTTTPSNPDTPKSDTPSSNSPSSSDPKSDTPSSSQPVIIAPSDTDKYIQGIVQQYGYDTETGVWGSGYSNDNGVHFYVTDTVYGRKYRQEDADRLWMFLSSKIKSLFQEMIEQHDQQSASTDTSDTNSSSDADKTKGDEIS